MPKLKPGTIIPTDEEDAKIRAGIAADPDMYEPTDEQFARMRPIEEFPRRGRPKLETPKLAIKLRLDPDVVAGFKAQGKGWQSRINETLRAALGLLK